MRFGVDFAQSATGRLRNAISALVSLCRYRLDGPGDMGPNREPPHFGVPGVHVILQNFQQSVSTHIRTQAI